jgi:hypothetical protein
MTTRLSSTDVLTAVPSAGRSSAVRVRHLPLVPGRRASARQVRVVGALGGDDLILATSMFDDRGSLDAGLASDAMRAAGRNLREIAPGLGTFLVLEAAEWTAGPSPAVDTVQYTAEGSS